MRQRHWQPKVLHVPGTDLQDVCVLGHQQEHPPGPQSQSRPQARLGPGLGEKLESLLLWPLEAVRRCARLE